MKGVAVASVVLWLVIGVGIAYLLTHLVHL
jgi:hypothetical protein